MTLDWCYMGDVRDGLRAFIAAGIRAQTCITSPPYWGLRDYGMPGQIGLEPTPAEYVANMVEVFRLVRDVLADDGTLWLNIGDSYASSGISGSQSATANLARHGASGHNPKMSAQVFGRAPTPEGLKAKDLVGIPWRLAFALQADGWYLRSDIIWHKPNPMPESVTDRPTKAHEYLFLLAKAERYFYDAAAIAEPLVSNGGGGFYCNDSAYRVETQTGGQSSGERQREWGRNRRTVWTVASQPYAEAHFAVMPRALVEPCVLAGTSAKGHCQACGKGWTRVVQRERSFESGSGRSGNAIAGKHADGIQGGGYGDIRMGPTISTQTLGWEPSCDCNAGDPVPGVVLDPFLGSGTVAQVAQDLGRRWIGCELNPEYLTMQHQRTAQGALVLAAD